MRIPTDKEYSNVEIQPCNRIQVKNIPDGVNAYIDTKRRFNINTALHINTSDTIESMIGYDLDNNENFFLFTFGTNENEFLELETESINSKKSWIRHTQNSNTTNLNPSTTKNLLDQTILLQDISTLLGIQKGQLDILNGQKAINKDLCTSVELREGTQTTHKLDTSSYNYIYFSSNEPFTMLINNIPIPMIEQELNVSLLNEITFTRKDGVNANISIWGA